MLDVYSAEKVSNSILCVSTASATPTLSAPKADSSTYNINPRLLITTGARPDLQVVCVKIGDGLWKDSINNPELFSTSGTIGKNTAVVFRAEVQSTGSKSVTVRCLDKDFAAPSIDVSRNFTILPSPFETITANATKVKAAHILALRTAVSVVRGNYGFSPVTWKEPVTAGTTSLKNWPTHILEIRQAITPAIDFINQFASGTVLDIPAVVWEPIGTGRPRAAVMNQLRDLILML